MTNKKFVYFAMQMFALSTGTRAVAGLAVLLLVWIHGSCFAQNADTTAAARTAVGNVEQHAAESMDLVFSGLSGYWFGTLEVRTGTADTSRYQAALDIRRSFDGSELSLHRSVRTGERISERFETAVFDADSILWRSTAVEAGLLEQHRYSLQGLHRVRSPLHWVIRQTETDSIQFRRITNILQHDSLLILGEISQDGLHWRTTEIMRLAHRAHPRFSTLFLPGFEHARRVSVVGNFNGWVPGRTPMRRGRGGWKINIQLPPGEYQYKFQVDDMLVRDLLSSSIIADGNGGYNAILTVE